MTTTHAVASAETYGGRYALSGAFNLVAGEDDDGDAAGDVHEFHITPEQVEAIEALLVESGANREKFLAWLKVTSVENIPASKYNDADNALQMIISRKKVDAAKK
jgi:hypothetical protein